MKACQICNENRIVEKCHIIPAEADMTLKRIKLYQENLILLCPLHHKLFDRGLLTDEEFSKISRKVYEIVYKYVAHWKRFEKWIYNEMKSKFRIDNEFTSIFSVKKWSKKIDRGLLKKGWIENLINDN